MKIKKRTLRDRLREDLRKPGFKRAFDSEDIPARLAVQIATLREAKGLTQKELAKKLGVTQQALSRLEDPESASFTLRTLQRFADVFHRKLIVEFR